MAVEIPPAEGGSITGTIFDAWQLALEDVGPAGADKGKGGKYLILPPGYGGTAPDGIARFQHHREPMAPPLAIRSLWVRGCGRRQRRRP